MLIFYEAWNIVILHRKNLIQLQIPFPNVEWAKIIYAFVTAHVRSTREGTIYIWECLFTTGGGGSLSIPMGIPHPSQQGIPHLSWQGVSPSFLTGGILILPDGGYPQLGLDGVPPPPPNQDWMAAENIVSWAVCLLWFPAGGLSCCGYVF